MPARPQTGVRQGSDRGWTGVRQVSDRGQTGVRQGTLSGLRPSCKRDLSILSVLILKSLFHIIQTHSTSPQPDNSYDVHVFGLISVPVRVAWAHGRRSSVQARAKGSHILLAHFHTCLHLRWVVINVIFRIIIRVFTVFFVVVVDIVSTDIQW